jgi:hypothetical protein
MKSFVASNSPGGAGGLIETLDVFTIVLFLEYIDIKYFES